jgi:hypothetical protein
LIGRPALLLVFVSLICQEESVLLEEELKTDAFLIVHGPSVLEKTLTMAEMARTFVEVTHTQDGIHNCAYNQDHSDYS